MHTGTICDIDPQGAFGLIDADDGHIVCFHRGNFDARIADNLQVGTRAAFTADRFPHDAHITEVRLWSARNGEN